MKTISARSNHDTLKWYVVDAKDKVLGRLAAEVAKRLRGKHLPHYTPHVAMGDGIIVINADKIRVTGQKATQKTYYHHTGYPGGIKGKVYQDMQEEYPERIVEKAIKGMLPKNKLGREIYGRLKVYKGEEHPHVAQKPENLNLS